MKIFSTLVLSSAIASTAAHVSKSETCSKIANHGCSAFCGFEGILAGTEYICVSSNKHKSVEFPFTISKTDRAEYCAMVTNAHGCDDICGYSWNEARGQCLKQESASQVGSKNSARDDPIIGGSGKFRYQYMPDLLQAPDGASLVNCHGLVTDKDNNIYLTYQVQYIT